jgi:hypothetical protein
MNETKTLLEQANALYSEGKLAESEAAFERVIASGNDVADGFYGVGLVRASARDWPAAIANFEKALEHNPHHANALYQLGYIAEQRNNSQKARAYYSAALSTNPRHRGAQQRLEQLGSAPILVPPPAPSNASNDSGGQEPSRGVKNGGSATRPPRSGRVISTNGPIVGVVRGLRARSEEDPYVRLVHVQVWTFSVERTDEAGNPIAPISVQMRGHQFDGVIEEGDEVEVPGRWRTGELARVKRVYNRTKGATVEARDMPGQSIREVTEGSFVHGFGKVLSLIAFVIVLGMIILVWSFMFSSFTTYGPGF